MKDSTEKSIEKTDNFEDILNDYPEFLKRSCLIKLGLWSSEAAAWASQNRGEGPPYIKRGRSVLYAKKDVIDWLRSSYREVN